MVGGVVAIMGTNSLSIVSGNWSCWFLPCANARFRVCFQKFKQHRHRRQWERHPLENAATLCSMQKSIWSAVCSLLIKELIPSNSKAIVQIRQVAAKQGACSCSQSHHTLIAHVPSANLRPKCVSAFCGHWDTALGNASSVPHSWAKCPRLRR